MKYLHKRVSPLNTLTKIMIYLPIYNVKYLPIRFHTQILKRFNYTYILYSIRICMLQIPVYDFKTNSRVADEFTTIYPSDVVIVEGILIFYHAKMRYLPTQSLPSKTQHLVAKSSHYLCYIAYLLGKNITSFVLECQLQQPTKQTGRCQRGRS